MDVYKGGIGVDDFTIAKTTHKPVVTNFDETQGAVTYNGITVESGEETPVPYNSDTASTFTITAKEGYGVEDIKVNGQSMGSSISNIELTNVMSAQTLNVSCSGAASEEASPF